MESNKNTFTIGQRVLKTPQNPYGFKIVNHIDLSSPAIITLGGNGTISNQFANGMAKIALNYLGTKVEDEFVNVYSVRYSSKFDDEKSLGFLDKEDINTLCDEIFLNRLTNENGTKKDVLSAQKEMRKITILSHCMGTDVLDVLIDTAANKMINKMGYTKQETKQILKNVFQIGYSQHGDGNFWTTNFYLQSFADDNKQLKASDFGFEEKNLGAGKFFSFGDNLYLVSNSFVGEDVKADEHNIGVVARDENWNVRKLDENKDFVNHRADAVSKCVSFLLAMSVLNSKENTKGNDFIPLPRVEEMQELVLPIIETENKSIRVKKLESPNNNL